MERTLTVTITTNPDIGTFDVDVLEGESGCTARFTDIPCKPNHEAFNKNIGNEIYSWAALMMDEEEEAKMIDKSTEMNHCITQIQHILHIIRPKKKWNIYYDKMNSENICRYTDWQRQYHGIRTGDEYIFIREEDEKLELPLLYVVNVSAESTLFAMSNLMKLLADKF